MIFAAAAKALSLLSCLFASSKISFDMVGFSPFVLAIVSVVFLNVISRSLSSNGMLYFYYFFSNLSYFIIQYT